MKVTSGQGRCHVWLGPSSGLTTSSSEGQQRSKRRLSGQVLVAGWTASGHLMRPCPPCPPEGAPLDYKDAATLATWELLGWLGDDLPFGACRNVP